MAYSDLQLNQGVSFNNLQSGVTQGYFVAITAIPVSAKQITKAEASTYVNINTALPSYAAKASNQLVVRDNLQGVADVYPYVIYALADIGGVGDYYGWISIDGGNNFNMLAVYPSATWTEIAGDVTGTYMAVVNNTINNQVYFSNNGGSMFSAVSLNGANFYPNGVSMSSNGQYIAISGFSGTANGVNVLNPKIAISSNYGASFSTYTYGTSFPLEIASGKISVSGNGQYITAIFSFLEYVGFPFNYSRPVSFKLTSSNYGASWAASNGTTYARFLGIALSNTGQYQFLTSDWYDRNNVFPSSWVQGIKGYISNDYGANWTEKFQDYDNNSVTVTYRNLKFAGISSSGSSMVAATGPLLFSSDQIMRYASSDYGANFSTFSGVANQQGLAVGQTPVTGITNSYATLFTPNSAMYYSTDGGFTAWFPKTIANRFFRHIYNRALNTPALPYSYTLFYNTTSGLPNITGFSSTGAACGATNSFIVYSSSSSIIVGSPLYYDLYGTQKVIASSYNTGTSYFKIGANNITFENLAFTNTGNVVKDIGYCVGYTNFYIENYSLDIIITNVTVNGYSLSNITGGGFPLYTGNVIGGDTTQQGYLNVVIDYSASTSGQRIEANDSNLTFTCNNTSTGSNSITLSSAYVGAGTFQIYAYDGTC